MIRLLRLARALVALPGELAALRMRVERLEAQAGENMVVASVLAPGLDFQPDPMGEYRIFIPRAEAERHGVEIIRDTGSARRAEEPTS